MKDFESINALSMLKKQQNWKDFFSKSSYELNVKYLMNRVNELQEPV
jgi:hypothetical protein